MEYTSLLLGSLLSTVGSLVLIVVWILNPKWRSLHHYISINQIVMGTLHLIAVNLSEIFENEILYNLNSGFMFINGYLYLASTCWSLCASLLAYLKLVLVFAVNKSNGKLKATLFSLCTLIIIKGISDFHIPSLFEIENHYALLTIRIMTVYVLTAVNLFLFIRIVLSVMPWGKTVVPKMKGKRVTALIGVAVLCDMTSNIHFFNFVIPGVLSDVTYLFNLRLIPHTIVVLFNRTSSDYWKKLKKDRRRRRHNVI